jgi:aminopeptidase N
MLSQTVTTTTGVEVTSVFMPEHAAAGEAALRAAASALETFSAFYGPYPYDHFVQIEGDFYDGMEYSGASFVGYGYYAEYDGTPNNLLTIISAHEVAHQWWHTLVGNDQATEPWLDEALATYSELAFLEAQHPESTAWWWAFRVDWFAPDGPVNSSIYDYGDFRGYVDAAYLRGAQMLHAMRGELDEEAFWGFLRRYAAEEAGRVATGGDFWAAYVAAGGDDAAFRSEYFK